MNTHPPAWAGVKAFLVRRILAKRLHRAGIEDASVEARHMLDAVCAGDTSGRWLDPDYCLGEDAAARLAVMCARREAREPLSHILGNWGFWTLDLDITRDVLTPRPETERLVETALAELGTGPATILDLGTGSGAIILSLLSERTEISGIGVDISENALKVAKANACVLNLDNRVQFIEGQWDAALNHAPFDLVVSNPPYIARAVIETLEPEVRRYEPMLALDGGVDGLDAYRALLPLMTAYLKPGGRFAFEIGADQGKAILALGEACDELKDIHLVPDLGGRDRVLVGSVD